MPAKNVNNHIIPQHHLKQFANDVGCIFTYPDPDKHSDAQCKGIGGGSVIKNTASEKGYYSPKIEEAPGKNFENKGSQIARKILEKQSVEREERTSFGNYSGQKGKRCL